MKIPTHLHTGLSQGRHFWPQATLFPVGAAIAIAVLGAGCSKQATSTTAAAPTASTDTVDTKNPDYRPEYKGVTFRMAYGKGGASAIVKMKGTLDKRLAPLGVKVQWLQFPMGPQMMEGIGAGSLDMGSCASTPPIFAQAAKTDFVYVATNPPGRSNGAILLPKNSPIKTVRDLKGKRIAFQPGSVWHYALVVILEKHGLKYEDIKPAKMPPADSSTAFTTGKIDAWIQGEPYVTLAQQKQDARILINTSQIGNTGGFYLGAKETVKKYPGLYRIALEEIQRAGAWAKANPHEAAVLTTERAGLDVPTIEKNLREGNDTRFLPVDETVIKRQQAQADLFFNVGILPSKINVREKVLTRKDYDTLLPDFSYGRTEDTKLRLTSTK